MSYGITPEGFTRKPESAIVESYETRQRALIVADLDVSPESFIGQLNGIIGRETGVCWELLAILAASNDPEQAEGVLLEQLAKLTGTERRAADYSRVILSCNLDAGTELETEVAYAAVVGNPANLWTPVENFTAPGNGVFNVEFRAAIPGPITANATTITVIHSPVVGWNGVTNALDALPGRAIDSDALLRFRREEQLANAGSATARAIRAAVVDVDGVESARVFENVTNVVDSRGLPPHSVEVIIFDGLAAVADEQAVARAIFETKTGGVNTFGSLSQTVIDDNGDEQIIRFNRVEQVPIYLTIDLDTGDGYVGDAAAAEHLVTKAREWYGQGDAVKARHLDSVVFGLPGVEDVDDFRLGTAPAPTGTANIAITSRQLATFDTSRVTVNS